SGGAPASWAHSLMVNPRSTSPLPGYATSPARHGRADQVLSPIVREIVERLQHQDLELQDRVIGLAAGVALALLGLRLRHGLDVSTEILPWHDLLDRFQRIAQSANRLQPTLNIEKPFCPMTRSLHPPMTAHGHRVRFVATWREEFFEVPSSFY